MDTEKWEILQQINQEVIEYFRKKKRERHDKKWRMRCNMCLLFKKIYKMKKCCECREDICKECQLKAPILCEYCISNYKKYMI